MQLETDRFLIRSLSEKDVSEQYLRWLQDEEVIRYLAARNRKNTRSEIIRYVNKHDDTSSFHLGIFHKQTKSHIGNFSVYYDSVHKTAQINVMIGEKEWWGKGTVLEARTAVMDFIFDNLGAYKVWATPFARNFAAVHNYLRQGFKKEGVFKEHKKINSDDRGDIIQFAMFCSDWKSNLNET